MRAVPVTSDVEHEDQSDDLQSTMLRHSSLSNSSESTLFRAVKERKQKRRRSAVLVFIVGFGAVFFLTATAGKARIEKRITERAVQNLKGRDFSGLSVEVDGRNVQLGGSVASQVQLETARQLIKDISLVSGVDTSGVRVAAANGTGLLPLKAVYNEGSLTLEGASPGAAAEAALIERASAGLGESKIVNQLTKASTGGPSPDASSYEALGSAFANFPRFNVRTAEVVVDARGLTITGTIADEASRGTLLDSLRIAIAPLGVNDRLVAETLSQPGSTVTNGTQVAAVSSSAPNDATTAPGSSITTLPSVPTIVAVPLPSDPALAASKQPEIDALLRSARIEFATDSSALTDASRSIISKVAGVLGQLPLNVEIGGHTDSRGRAAKNLTLSQQRADAVKNELVRLGFPAGRITAVGFGSSKLLAADDSARGNPANRRIEIILK
jgi:outer membrane protein OmpA-like peptidoglycan-associated protein/osmotically-inducible protein OsmY